MRLDKPRVLVVGDYMTDYYWLGTTERLSPEAPIPVVKINETKELPGGAGNVAANLRALGAEVVEVPGYPEDELDTDGYRLSSTWPVPIKHRLMIGDTQVARWDLTDYCKAAPAADIQRLGKSVDAVVVADYLKGSVTPEVVEAIKTLNLVTFVDTKGDPTPYRWTKTRFFPNAKEYEKYQAAYSLCRKVIVKQGAAGATELTRTGCPEIFPESDVHCPSMADYVRSVNGAGDTVMAAYVYATLCGCTVSRLEFAMAAAAVAVEKPYTATVTVKEIEKRLGRSISRKRRAA